MFRWGGMNCESEIHDAASEGINAVGDGELLNVLSLWVPGKRS